MRALRVQPVVATIRPAPRKKVAEDPRAAFERANRAMTELAEVLTLSTKALEESDADLADLITDG